MNTTKARQAQAKVGGRKKKAKVHIGPKGGKYVIKRGKKVYM